MAAGADLGEEWRLAVDPVVVAAVDQEKSCQLRETDPVVENHSHLADVGPIERQAERCEE
jgi:hypothetical protein